MGRLLALCAGILVLAMLVRAGWSQETPAPAPPVDPLAQALAAVKSPAAMRASDLQDARNYLVGQRQVARPLMVQLLGDPDPQVRMNATIVLAEMANAGDTSAATVQALQTAVKDKDFAVAYWGFQGLMNDGVPAADQATAINEMLKMERPHALRVAALMTIDDKKPKLAAPIIVNDLQEILQEYSAQVETLVSSAETIQRAGPTPFAPPATGAPGPTLAPPPPSQPTSPRPTGVGPAGMPPPHMPTTSRFSGAGGIGMRRFGPGGGGFAPGAVAPRAVTPRAVTPMAPRLETQRVLATQVRRSDLSNMTLDQLQALTRGVEALPLVAEVHQMGLVLEDIVSNSSPDAPLFDFKTTAPWDLDKCVDKAVIYMNAHRTDYGAAPEAAPPAPTTPAAPPEAPPETGAAPATTAATPAATTPTP